jgi:methylenetetrahydrofolate reductase (NADPH)
MPISNFAQAVKFSASVPDWLATLFEGTDNDPETRRMVGPVIASEQARVLQTKGADGFLFIHSPELI